LAALVASGGLAFLPSFAGAVEAPIRLDVPVTAYMVKEVGSQGVLMAKDIDYPVSPASLTKVMTSIMAIESGRMDEVVTIPVQATLVEPTRAGLRPGEQVRLRDLVKAAMVNSSNDAAFAIGLHLGGSVESFASRMNARARSLGMNNTRFTNPAGYDRNEYADNRSTARDLMLLTEHAVRYREFNEIANMRHVSFRDLKSGRTYSLRTHNKMFDLYPYTVGIKTGYTNRAGKCLIARAVRERKDLLMVMLDAKTDRWAIASNMFDRGFGINGPDRPTVCRDSGAISRPSAKSAAANRQQALRELRRKVARQGTSAATAGVAHGKGKPARKAVVEQRRNRKAVLAKAGKSKLSPREKRLAARLEKRAAKAVRIAKHSKVNVKRVVASKSGNRARVALKAKKKGGPVTKVARQKQRKAAISMVKPAKNSKSKS
jgi:D-alanyl-D-alanine carboxypeptidase (penicillin-binding protein 5/6)